MKRALQVSFRRLIPSEQLVELAGAGYRRVTSQLETPSEFLVSLCNDAARALTVAHVCLVLQGDIRVEARASHQHPERALESALLVLEERVSNK